MLALHVQYNNIIQTNVTAFGYFTVFIVVKAQQLPVRDISVIRRVFRVITVGLYTGWIVLVRVTFELTGCIAQYYRGQFTYI